MLGSDPVAALLGAGVDPKAPEVVWKGYLRRLAAAGCAVTITGPSVEVPEGADRDTIAALADLAERYPSTYPMPSPTTGVLAGAGQIDTTGDRINSRVGAYFRAITKVVGAERAPSLFACGAITASGGLHVGRSHMVSVAAPNAEALTAWRTWAVAMSGDKLERHTLPTLIVPGYPGGGVYLFRTPTTAPPGTLTAPGFVPLGPVSLTLEGCRIDTGDVVVPIPPTRMNGESVQRLGPCRMLPLWLETILRESNCAAAV